MIIFFYQLTHCFPFLRDCEFETLTERISHDFIKICQYIEGL
jgi:hypothetical protein